MIDDSEVERIRWEIADHVAIGFSRRWNGEIFPTRPRADDDVAKCAPEASVARNAQDRCGGIRIRFQPGGRPFTESGRCRAQPLRRCMAVALRDIELGSLKDIHRHRGVQLSSVSNAVADMHGSG